MIKLGNNSIGSIYLGSNPIGKAYLGNYLVFQKGGSGPVIPAGYTKLTYVESPLYTESYINTGVTVTNSTGFYIDGISLDPIGNTTYGCLFGSRAGSNQSDFQLSTYIANTSSFSGTFRRGSSTENYDAHLTPNVRFRASLTGNTYTIDSTDYTTASNITSGKRIYLFALNNNDTAAQFGHVRIYRFKLYNSTTEVLDYIPCRRDADNVVGFYDIVAGEFVAPTSGVLYGVDIAANSYDSTVPYLEFAGASALNTGLGIHKGSTRVEIQCQVTDNYSSTQIISGGGTSRGQWFGNVYVNNEGRYGLGSNSSQCLPGLSSEKKTITIKHFLYETDLTDGENTIKDNYSATATVLPLQIGRSGTVNLYYASMKVWYVKVYEGETLVRDFIPVQKDSVGYFYDRVTGLLFPNVGTSPFIIGT